MLKNSIKWFYKWYWGFSTFLNLVHNQKAVVILKHISTQSNEYERIPSNFIWNITGNTFDHIRCGFLKIIHYPVNGVSQKTWIQPFIPIGKYQFSTVCLTFDPPTPQGYKMDDLLTSYISQMLTTMTKQRTSRGNSKWADGWRLIDLRSINPAFTRSRPQAQREHT